MRQGVAAVAQHDTLLLTHSREAHETRGCKIVFGIEDRVERGEMEGGWGWGLGV